MLVQEATRPESWQGPLRRRIDGTPTHSESLGIQRNNASVAELHKMPRNDYDYDFDDEYDLDDEDEFDSGEELYFDDEEELEPDRRAGGKDEDDVEVSMEVDAQGNEIWYAQDPKVPGSSSMGHSAEEAVEGLEDRRRQYREILSRSRDGDLDEEEEIPEPEHSGEQDVRISMEVDEKGNEIWFAKDPRVPGSGSMGHSAEEAVEGLEERRRKFREMLRKSRERKKE
jgi:predicted RNase H-like HicB family nuclease